MPFQETLAATHDSPRVRPPHQVVMLPAAFRDTRAARCELSEVIALDDEWRKDLLLRADTAFSASVNPDGQPGASHRGGPPGFLTLDAATSSMRRPE